MCVLYVFPNSLVINVSNQSTCACVLALPLSLYLSSSQKESLCVKERSRLVCVCVGLGFSACWRWCWWWWVHSGNRSTRERERGEEITARDDHTDLSHCADALFAYQHTECNLFMFCYTAQSAILSPSILLMPY